MADLMGRAGAPATPTAPAIASRGRPAAAGAPSAAPASHRGTNSASISSSLSGITATNNNAAVDARGRHIPN
eukprot:395998-Pyramimonas_sp.AAC.1